MKYSERDALVESLREFADFIEEKGIELPTVPTVSATLYLPYYNHGTYEQLTPRDKKAMVKKIVRLLKPVKKEYVGTSLYVKRTFGTKLQFTMSVTRDIVCKAVPTGNKVVHAAHYIPERVEEEVEWVCTDPLLKAS